MKLSDSTRTDITTSSYLATPSNPARLANPAIKSDPMSRGRQTKYGLLLACLLGGITQVQAACVDAVVLVHGNTATPASWNNTYNYL
ncbi:MAG: hypothetical protein KKF79_19185, partial [Gammaproteobacteria bacterium]|nr:hypothetical protein [Gammaproteobacteria bacterium]